jgi:predicted CxxxxCH...CXXCH cytochrome family protein
MRSQPRWDGGEDEAVCGSCHGIPPADHAQDECATCHSTVIAADGTFVAPELHIDAIVQVGADGAGECTGCHGSAESPAPPRDLAGRTDTSLVTVGAHAAHLEAPYRLRGPVECSDCHVVPDTVLALGHLDSALPAEAFPGGASFGGLASAGGAAPAWDRETATCSDVYCHGGGTVLAGDGAAGLVREPVWTRLSAGQASCGACHGIPPIDATHATDLTLRDCNGCHTSVDAFGNIVLTGPATAPASEHMDGDVDVR